jgi:phosphocarrier protein HPr
MPTITVTLVNKVGLHARPAGTLVRVAKPFPCDIKMSCKGKQANAKSILSILSLGAEGGAEVTIEAVGPEAERALQVLRTLIEDRFGEPE